MANDLNSAGAPEVEYILPPAPGTSLAVRDAAVTSLAARFMAAPSLLATDGKTRVTAELARVVAETALLYELDPLLGHLMLYEGKAYITAQGLSSWAEGHPMYDGYDWRVLSIAERTDMGKADMEVGVEVLIFRKDRTHPTREYGFASSAKPYRGNVVERSHALEMAHKRAYYRGLMKACPPNMTRRRLLDPDLPLDEQQYRARLAAVPTHPDRPQGVEWREFYRRCGQAGIAHDEALRRVKAAGFDLTWVDPETGETRDSMVGFEGTVYDALVIVGLEQPRVASGTPRPVAADPKSSAQQRRRRHSIDAANAEATAAHATDSASITSGAPTTATASTTAAQTPEGHPNAPAAAEAAPGPPQAQSGPSTPDGPAPDETGRFMARIRAMARANEAAKLESDIARAAGDGTITGQQATALVRQLRSRESALRESGKGGA